MNPPAELDPLPTRAEQVVCDRVGDLDTRETRGSVRRRRLGLDERAQRLDHLGRPRAKVSQQQLVPVIAVDSLRSGRAPFGVEAKLSPRRL